MKKVGEPVRKHHIRTALDREADHSVEKDIALIKGNEEKPQGSKTPQKKSYEKIRNHQLLKKLQARRTWQKWKNNESDKIAALKWFNYLGESEERRQ